MSLETVVLLAVHQDQAAVGRQDEMIRALAGRSLDQSRVLAEECLVGTACRLEASPYYMAIGEAQEGSSCREVSWFVAVEAAHRLLIQKAAFGRKNLSALVLRGRMVEVVVTYSCSGLNLPEKSANPSVGLPGKPSAA